MVFLVSFDVCDIVRVDVCGEAFCVVFGGFRVKI